MVFDISGWKFRANRNIYLISRPFNLLMLTSFLALVASVSTIIILKLVIDMDVDDIRSANPHDPMVLHIFSTARGMLELLSYTMIILTIIVVGAGAYTKFFGNDKIETFNQYLIGQYKTDNKPVTRLCFVLLLTIFTGVLLLPYIAYLLASPWPLIIDKPAIRATDKRWFIFTYNYIWFFFLILIPTMHGILAHLFNGQAKMPQQNIIGGNPVMISSDISLKNNYGKLLFAIFIAWLLYGPPWNISSLIRPINSHIFYTISSYQAIDAGYMLNIGPASFLYGPGTQLIVYIYQKINGGLGLVPLRESYAFINWLAATIYFSFGLVVFGKLRGAIIISLSVIISPLIFYQWNEGILVGIYGWSNALRYIAIPIVTILTIRTIAFSRTDEILIRQNILIGIFWGLMAYIAQENGVLTLISVITVLLAALSSRTINLKQAKLIILSLMSGAMIVFVPILLVYLMYGEALEFIQNYRKMPALVFNGAASAYWLLRHYANYYLFVPLLALLIGMGCFLKSRPFGFVSQMSIDRLVLLAVVMTVILAHMSSIIHASDTHVINAQIGMPILFALLLFLPTMNRSYQKTRILIIAVIIISVLPWLIPDRRHPEKIYPRFISSRIESFSLYLSNRSKEVGRDMDDSRLPETVLQLDECCNRPVGLSGHDLENIAATLKEKVGERQVHIDSFPGLGLPGILLFIGDINPASTYTERSEFPTVKSRINYRNETLERLDEIKTLVTADLSRTIPDRLLKLHPDAEVLKIESKAGDYYIIIISNSIDSTSKIKS